MKRIKLFLLLFSIIFLIYPIKNVFAESGSFSDLQLLINYCDTDELILEKDYENLGSEGQITINKDIVLDLNGHVINGHYVNRIFNIESNANVTIKDSNKEAVHKFDVDKWLLATLNEETGSVSINGGCITGGDVTSGTTNKTHLNGKGSGIYINSGSLTIESGNIIGNKISDKFQFGAGIAAENGSTININGGMVSYNRTTWEGYGAGIYLNNSNLIMNGGEISYNYGIYGGGINAYDNSSVTVNDGVISNNTAGHNGGGIALMVLDANVASGVTSKAIINGGVIENNTVVTPLIGVGGGISTCKGADLTINGGVIQKNTANRGGGVGAWNGGNIKIFGGMISENISSEDTTPSDGSSGNHGAGVFFDTYFISGYGSVDASLTVGKDAVITGNMNAVSKKEDNVYLASGQKLNIARGDEAPKEGMNVSINMEVNDNFVTNGTSSDAKYFSVDNSDYYVKYESDSLKSVKDTVDPTGKITLKEDSFTSFINTITFGLFYAENIDVIIEASDDNGIKSIEYYMSQTAKTLDEVKAITTWTEYEEFSIESETEYIIYAKITDKAGHVTYISSNGFILDKTLPEIIGIDYNNGVYYTTQKFTVLDDNIDKVLINGVEVDEYILPGNVDETYEIDVYDKAGNTTYISIRMMSISTIGMLLDEYTVENVTLKDKDDIKYVKDKVNSINITYATDNEKNELKTITDKCDLLLETIENKYISEVEITVTKPKTGQTVENNTFEITSKYDDIVIEIKEWKINGGSEVLPSDYVFEKDKLYIPILKIERKNQTYYFDENTTLTIHGSNWSNSENTYKLKDHKDYGYVKELSDASFLIDEMTVSVLDYPVYEVVVGANQTYVIDKDKEVLFRINAEYSLFEGKVFVDDILLEQKDYISEEGSTIIILKKEFVDSLKVGKHTLKVEFSDGGKAITNFVIERLKEENPKTGDNINLYIIVGCLSFVGLIGSWIYLTKKKFN